MTILELLKTIPDPRMIGKVTHPLSSLLFTTLCGVLSGCESWGDIEDYCEVKQDWLSQYVDLSQGIPSEWTFRRLFILLEPDYLSDLLQSHARALIGDSVENTHIAIDGKALKGSGRRQLRCLRSVSAWCHEKGVVLAEQAIEANSNETKAIPLLIEHLHLAGTTVSIDAAGCQKNIAKLIKEKKGEYVLGLKTNHPTLYQAASKYVQGLGDKPQYCLADAFDSGHGRVVRRRYFGYDCRSLNEVQEWSGAKSLVAVETISCLSGISPVTAHWRYYLTSHKADHPQLPQYIRQHWSIENQLHWVLDVHLKEDDDRKSERRSARCFALLKRIALNIVRSKQIPSKKRKQRSLRGQLKRAGWDNSCLVNLLV